MKTIKNLMALVLFTFTLTAVHAQSEKIKDLLINKWIIDKDAMKPVIAKVLATNPEFAALDETGKEETLNGVMDQELSGIKIEYKKDGTYAGADTEGNVNGNWTLSKDEKELTTKEGDKPEKKYTIVNISKTVLHLKLIDKQGNDTSLSSIYLKATGQ